MKKWCLAALAFAITSLTATFAQLPTGYGNHYSPQELAVWRTRSVSGPYRAAGDVITNSPGDWNRTVTFANAFKANPYNAGNDNLEARNIWTGWTITIVASNDQVPVWQGFKMQAAGLYYLVKGDTSYGNAVRRAILYQITIPAAQVGTWSQTAIPYESGFFEANWLMRILSAYDYTKGLYSAAERTQVENWFRSSANYYCARLTSGPIGQCFPKRLLDDYTVVSRDAQPGGIPLYAPDPIYPPSTDARHIWAGDGYIHTHMNPDGSKGNKVSRLAMHFNNRIADKMSYVGQLGVMLNDAFYKLHGKQYAKEWIKYSVYPDNTMGEYERNGDYSNPNQGFQYGAKNVAQFVLLADALARKGDFSLYQYVTSEGAHNTIGGSKSILSVLTRFGNNFIGSDPIYCGSVATNNRIDNLSENDNKMVVWDYLIAISNKYYQSGYLKNIYMRTASGALPYTNRLTTVGGVWVAWNGPCGEKPGVLFMDGQLENLNVYQYPCSTPTGISAQGITQTNASVSWDAMSMAANYYVRYRAIGASVWRTDTLAGTTFAMSGLTANTGYQVQVQTSCQSGNASAWSATYSFTTLPPICVVPQNLSVNTISPTEAELNVDLAAAAISYTFDFREQGSSTWVTTTVATLPITLTLAPTTTYQVRILANCSATNSSEYCNEITFTTGTPPCPNPDQLNSTVYSPDSATMRWNFITGASDYKLRFKPVSSSNWKFVISATNVHSEGNLLSGTPYEFQVMTNCLLGNSSSYSPSAFFTTQVSPCPEVTSIVASTITQTSATLAYTSTGTGVVRYEIRYRTLGSTTWTVTPDVASPLALSTLTAATNYEVQGRALCNQDTSNFSASTLFTTATPLPTCSVPTGLAASSIITTGATLTWAAVSGSVGYQLQYRTGTGAFISVPTIQPTTVLAALNSATTYNVQVRTTCAAGLQSAFTSVVNFTTATPPPPTCSTPTSFAASNLLVDGATVGWVPVAGALSYDVQYRTGNGAFITLNTTQPARVLSGLLAGTTYTAKVRSNCAAGQQSAFTSIITFTTLPPVCGVPTGLSFSGITATSATINWTRLAGVQSYTMRYRAAGQPAWTVVSLASSPLTLSSLAGATQYEVQVQASCAPGNESGFSQSVTFSTTGQVCYTPINLTAEVQDEDSVYITWSGIPGNLGYQVVFYNPASPSVGAFVDTVQSHRNGFNGLTPGRTYGVKVMTLCPIGTSYYSSSVVFTMPAGCSASGAVRKEVWGNLIWQPGQAMPSRLPDAVMQIPSLEDSSRALGGNVLARVKGTICPPATGNYIFHLSGSQMAELYLSTVGTDSTTRQRIAFVASPTGFRQFNSQPSATSVAVRLVKGVKYYMEVVYASQNNLAHFSLAWKTPQGDAVTLITPTRFTSSAGTSTATEVSAPIDLSNIYSLYPNPSSPSATVYIAGPEGQAQVSVSDATGKLAWKGSLILGAAAQPLPSSALQSGLYVVQILNRQGNRQTLRMVVR